VPQKKDNTSSSIEDEKIKLMMEREIERERERAQQIYDDSTRE
jgi:hypothetical protein